MISCYDNSECVTENLAFAVVVFRTDSQDYTYRLPLNNLQDTVTYGFDSIIVGQLSLIYNRKQRLIHPDCGLETVFEIDTALTPLSNNLSVVDKEIKKPISNNIEIIL